MYGGTKPAHASSPSLIQSLKSILNHSLDALETALYEQQLPPLNLDPVPHPLDKKANKDGDLPSIAVFNARRNALAAIGMLKAVIQPTQDALLEATLEVVTFLTTTPMLANRG